MQTVVQQTQFFLELWTDSKGLIMGFFFPTPKMKSLEPHINLNGGPGGN